jgi:hypothetical protein
MNLQDLNSKIHSATKLELQANFSTWKSQISNILSLNKETDIQVFCNHVGRELIRKCYFFGLIELIEEDFGSGLRPQPIKYDNETLSKSLDIKNNPNKKNNKHKKNKLKGSIISWYDALDSSSYELDGEFINSVKDKAGSYDLSSVKPGERPTLHALTFPDGKSRNTFYFPPGVVNGQPGPNNSGTTLRSYDFTHSFSADGELNLVMVVNFVPSGTTDPQDFIFEASNDGIHPKSPLGRLFLRKLGENQKQTPSMNSSGGGQALSVSESDTGYNLFNPITILFNLHLSNGLQISRYNGIEVKRSTTNNLTNIEYEALNPSDGRKGGGIWYGSNWWGQSQLEGGIGEIILYDDFKDSSFIENFLSNKWGIEIPSIKRFNSF